MISKLSNYLAKSPKISLPQYFISRTLGCSALQYSDDGNFKLHHPCAIAISFVQTSFFPIVDDMHLIQRGQYRGALKATLFVDLELRKCASKQILGKIDLLVHALALSTKKVASKMSQLPPLAFIKMNVFTIYRYVFVLVISLKFLLCWNKGILTILKVGNFYEKNVQSITFPTLMFLQKVVKLLNILHF